MHQSRRSTGKLLAISDLHVAFAENRPVLEALRPTTDDDWLLVAGDVGERVDDIAWALERLAGNFSTVVWTPGNHELWTPRGDHEHLRGVDRYEHLVSLCRDLGVLTPEDEYPVWQGEGGPLVVAPLFLLYDYSFLPPGAATKEDGLAQGYDRGVVCSDEFLLHPDPYPSREAWCEARLAYTEERLAAVDPALQTVLVNHWPLVREPTERLWYQEFALWCGTQRTADWHVRFRAAAVVYGHLHIPTRFTLDGVPFVEVSVGYPREWQRRAPKPLTLREVVPRPPVATR